MGKTVKTFGELKEVMDKDFKKEVNEHRDEELSRAIETGANLVVSKIEEINLEERLEGLREAAEIREEYHRTFNEMNTLKQRRSQMEKAFEDIPQVEELIEEYNALHKRLFSTQPDVWGKIPQVPPEGRIAKAYNKIGKIIELLKKKYFENIDAQIDALQPAYEEALAFRRKEQKEWDEGKK